MTCLTPAFAKSFTPNIQNAQGLVLGGGLGRTVLPDALWPTNMAALEYTSQNTHTL